MMKQPRLMNLNFKKFKKVKRNFKDNLKMQNKKLKDNKITMKKQKRKFYKCQMNQIQIVRRIQVKIPNLDNQIHTSSTWMKINNRLILSRKETGRLTKKIR